jgi:hypothetical protein
MTVDNVRRNLILGVPAVAIGAQAVAHRAFAQQNASRVNGVAPHEAFRDVKERFVNEAIGITREALDQASVLEALEWQGEFPQSALFRALEIPILPAHLDDTTYDYADLRRRYPVQLGVTSVAADSHRHVVSPRVIPAIDKDRDASFRRDGYLSDGYGNCFYWNAPDTIVTTEHLAERFPESWHSLRRDGFDISVASVAPHFAARSPEQVIRDDPSVSDADIHGSLVCIVGRIRIRGATWMGQRCTGGRCQDDAAVHPRRAGRNSSDEQTGHVIARIRTFHSKIQDRMDNSYLMILPPGEARGIRARRASYHAKVCRPLRCSVSFADSIALSECFFRQCVSKTPNADETSMSRFFIRSAQFAGWRRIKKATGRSNNNHRRA